MSAQFNTNASQLSATVTRTACAYAKALVAFDFYDRHGYKRMARYYNGRYFATLDKLDALGVLDEDNRIALNAKQRAAVHQTMKITRAQLATRIKQVA